MFFYKGLAFSLLIAIPALVQAADSPTPPAADSPAPPAANPPSPQGDQTVQMQGLTVAGVPVDQIILPSSAPTNSVFGDEMSVQDTPRSVSVLSSQLVNDLNINGPLDFVEGVSGTSTLDQFGGANVVDIRGEAAEVFQNGIRRTERSDGMPLSFNAIEGFDVVKGPASVDYGAGSLVGGYVNFVTKRPNFEDFSGVVDYTYGEFGEQKAQIDITGPFDDGKAAYRFSDEEDYENTYYNNVYFHMNDFYGALSFKPNSHIRFDFNTDFHLARYVENPGLNRVTQELVTDHLYYAGPAEINGVVKQGNNDVVENVRPVYVNREQTLVAIGDHDDGRDENMQFDTYIYSSPDSYWVNRDYLEYYTLQQRQYAQRYYNNVAYSLNFQNRTEFHHSSTGAHGSSNEIIAGNSFQVVDTLSYADLYNEYLNAMDLTTNPATWAATMAQNLVGVVPVPGFGADVATPGANYHLGAYPNTDSGTLASLSYDDGVFFQDIHHFSDEWFGIIGVRGDIIHDRAMDPLPPPGYASLESATDEGQGAGDVSLSFKPVPISTYYATASVNQSESGGAGGAPAALSTNHLSPESFHVLDYLLETGAKYSFLDNHLFLTTAFYHQIRHNTNVLGVVTQTNVTGAELEATYQPNKNFYAGLTFSKGDYYTPHETSGGSTRSPFDDFAPPYGNGVGSPNNLALPGISRQIPGIPQDEGSAYVNYKMDNGFGVSANITAENHVQADYIGQVEIPGQYSLNASVFYDVKRYEVRVNFYNVTNQWNWTADGGVFGNDVIMPNLPFHVDALVKYRF
jgi:outer membrane receptor protein involved in Fe transport